MMDTQKGKILFECDGCGEVLETKRSDIDAANQVRKDQGWVARPEGSEWKHYCPGCKGLT